MVRFEVLDFNNLDLIHKANTSREAYQVGVGYLDKTKERELESAYKAVQEKMEDIRGHIEAKTGFKFRKSSIRNVRSRNPKMIQHWIWYYRFYSDEMGAGEAASLQFSIGPDEMHTATIWFEYADKDRKQFLSAFEKIYLKLDRKMFGFVESKTAEDYQDRPVKYNGLIETPDSFSEFKKCLSDPNNAGGIMFTHSADEIVNFGEKIKDSIANDVLWMQQNVYSPIFEGSLKQNSISLHSEDMDKKELRNDLNLILYGPPGTGKTYLTKKLAANCIRLTKNYRIESFEPEKVFLDKILLELKEKKSEMVGTLRNDLGKHDGPFIEIGTSDKKYIYGVWLFQKISHDLLFYIQVWPSAKTEDDKRLVYLRTHEKNFADALGLKFLQFESSGKKPPLRDDIILYNFGKNVSQIDGNDTKQIIYMLLQLDKAMNETK